MIPNFSMTKMKYQSSFIYSQVALVRILQDIYLFTLGDRRQNIRGCYSLQMEQFKL